MTSLPFTPNPSAAAKILDDFTDSPLPIRNIAAAHNTSSAALSQWLLSPEVRERIELIRSAMALRATLSATSRAHTAIAAAVRILEAFNASPPQPRQPDPASTPAHSDTLPTIHLQWCESARRAAHLILRFATFDFGRAARERARAHADSSPGQTPAPPARKEQPPGPHTNRWAQPQPHGQPATPAQSNWSRPSDNSTSAAAAAFRTPMSDAPSPLTPPTQDFREPAIRPRRASPANLAALAGLAAGP